MTAGALFAIIAPIFAMIVMGQLAIRFKIIDRGGLRGLNDLVFFAALPCLLFRSVVEAPEFSVLAIASAYFTAGLAIYAAAFALALLVLRTGLSRAAMLALNASYGNTVLMGVPVIAGAYGVDGVSSLLGIVSLQSIVFLPMTTVLMEIGGNRRTNLRTLLRITVLGDSAQPDHSVPPVRPDLARRRHTRTGGGGWMAQDAGSGGAALGRLVLPRRVASGGATGRGRARGAWSARR